MKKWVARLSALLFVLMTAGYANADAMQSIMFTDRIEELEAGLSVVAFEGDDLFTAFLEAGGAQSDAQVASFLTAKLLTGEGSVELNGQFFGCSTLSAQTPEGQRLFGRNFDWNHCNALIVRSTPEHGYASVSTVNTDFISASGVPMGLLPHGIRALIGLYAPLDGMNAAGLAVSVNMIQDNATIAQETDKPDLTTTTTVRLLLNQAATVDEAIGLLTAYDLHASMGMMVHFAIADKAGRSVVVEYIDNEMVVTETPVVTNFYLSEGEKNGVGTQQSHERYEQLMRLDSAALTMDAMRDAMDSVSKDNFGGFESTEWSIVMNQRTGEMRYFHREDYENGYVVQLLMEE